MSLSIASLNSGSNGNCYYVGNGTEAILVDAGISCREIDRRLTRLNLSVKKIKALFISHEHSDHIRGVQVFSKKHRIPVYITGATLHSSGLQLEEELTLPFRAYEEIKIGNLTVTAFPKLHDAADPHSFIVSDAQCTVGVFTDIGFVCEHVIENFKQCDAVFLESNYDEKMLEEGAYPFYLKRRIQGDKGHLSNTQALKLFTDHRPAKLTHILLSHLSRDNNSPQLVHQLFSSHAENTKVVVASRDYETDVFHISSESVAENDLLPFEGHSQMTLF